MTSDAQTMVMTDSVPAAHAHGGRRWLATLVRVALVLAVLAAGAIAAGRLIATAPQAVQRPPLPHATLVAVRSVERGEAAVTVEAMGHVVAAQAVELSPQVSGEVVVVHPAFELGGRIAAGETLVRIDPALYEAAVAYAEATLARRLAELDSANREVRRFATLQERDAANRKEIDDAATAKAVAEADVAAARAAYTQAQLDLAHTEIRAPYNGIVTSEAVTPGARVTPATRLASFVGTDAYWVQISVPVDRLGWMEFPSSAGEGGSAVRILQQVGTGRTGEWQGRVLRLLGDLEPQGRMARVLVEAPHPLDTHGAEAGGQPLLLDAYVNVEIAGRRVPDVAALSRSELRTGDSVWLMNAEGLLEIRPVEVIYRGADRVLIGAGLSGGERLITSDLATPVAGMRLRLEGAPAAAGKESRS